MKSEARPIPQLVSGFSDPTVEGEKPSQGVEGLPLLMPELSEA